MLSRLTRCRQADLAWRLYSQLAIVRNVPLGLCEYNQFLQALSLADQHELASRTHRVAADMASQGLLSPTESEEQVAINSLLVTRFPRFGPSCAPLFLGARPHLTSAPIVPLTSVGVRPHARSRLDGQL